MKKPYKNTKIPLQNPIRSEILPKKRPDLDVPAYRFLRLIRENDLSASPPKIVIDYLPVFGRQVLEIRRSFRRRWSYRTTTLKNRRQKRDNRMTIPVSYLVLRWKKIDEDSTHWPLVEEAKIDPYKRSQYGLFYDSRSQTWELLFYQVVEDINHLRRMFVHIFAQYQREIKGAIDQRSQTEKRLIDDFLTLSLSPQAKKEMERFSRYVDRRETEVGRIGAVLEGRNFMAHYYAQRMTGLLYAVARNLENALANLPKLNPMSVVNLQTRLRPEVNKLESIVSSNIRYKCRRAQKQMVEGIELLNSDPTQAQRLLGSAINILRGAAGQMENWAATISDEEMAEAKAYRQAS